MAKLTQKSLEETMVSTGTAREEAHYQRMIKLKDFSSTAVGGKLRDESYSAMLEQVRIDMKRRKPGSTANKSIRESLALFRRRIATPELVCAIGVCAVIDCLMLRMSYPQAAGYIGRMLDDEMRFAEFRKKNKSYWQEVEREKNRRGAAKAKEKIKEISRRFIELKQESVPERSRAGLYILATFERVCGLLTTYKLTRPNGRQIRFIIPTPATADWIDSAIGETLRRHPFYLPCIEKPLDWSAPYGGGYISGIVARHPLVKSHSKEYIRTLEEADMGRVYDAVNALQNTRWQVNTEITKVAKEMLDAGSTFAGCHSGERAKLPTKWPEVDTDNDQRKTYRRACARVYEINHLAKAKRLSWGKIVSTAHGLAGETIYFPHHLCFRGRAYPTASIMTPQGDDLSLAMLKFDESQMLVDSGDWRWVRIQGANLFGIDKVPFADRMLWVATHEAEILASAKDPFEFRWWADADKPMSFLAWCKEYAGSMLEGKPWSLPVNIDGSNNGLQIYSFLLRDAVAGAATNCVPGERPNDIYQDVADIVTHKLEVLSKGGDEKARAWLAVVGGRLPRGATKRPVMTLVYGSTKYSCLQYTAEWFGEHCIKSGTNEFAVDMYKDIQYLAELIWSSIDAVVESARKGMNWIRDCADMFSENALDVHWTTPVGFEVMQRYTKLSGSKSVHLSFGKKVETVGYREQTSLVDARRSKNGLAPNVIHSLDGAVMMEVTNRMHAAGCRSFRAVHDSFGTLPKDMSLLAKTVRRVYADFFGGDWLSELRDQWQAQMPRGVVLPPTPRQGLMSTESVMRSEYFFA